MAELGSEHTLIWEPKMAPQKYEKTEALTRFSWEKPLFSTNISTGFIAMSVYPIEDRIDVKKHLCQVLQLLRDRYSFVIERTQISKSIVLPQKEIL